MPRVKSKSIQIRKRRGFYKAEAVQARVIAGHFSGQSNRKIADVEEIDPGTVGRILSKPEVARMKQEYRADTQSQLRAVLPKAARVVADALDSADLRIALSAAMKLLEGFQVFPRGGTEQPNPERDSEHGFLVELGRITYMAIKHRKYGTTLPPGLEEMEDKARNGPKTIKNKAQTVKGAVC